MKNNFGNYIPSVQQTINNSTGWIGHMPGNDREIVRGQTFVAENEGDLEAIEIMPTFISSNGQLHISLHSYDALDGTWGPALDTSLIDVQREDVDHWVAFNMHGLHLDRGKTYGFRMRSDGSCIGVAEALLSASQPVHARGQEWAFEEGSAAGDAFTYISLAFKVDIRA